ncbi:hypothetical protein BGX26_003663 [Mortierella sp. AD094]|nr:hypothetical protein BGX26_003663 [Mortierella sp. AD094]
MNSVLLKIDNLDHSLTTLADSLGSSTSFSDDPTHGLRAGLQSQSLSPFVSGETHALAKLEKLQKTVDGISSSLSSSGLLTDSSQPPAYKETGPPELVRIRNKIELIKGLLVDAVSDPKQSGLKPPAPDLALDDDDDIFIAWCTAGSRTAYKQALYKMLNELQAQETKEWKSYMSSTELGKDVSDSLYRKHLRAKINAAKRAVSEYHQKKIEGKVKPGIPDLPSDHSLLDVDVFKVMCLQSSEFYPPGTYFTTPPYDKGIADLITKLKGMEEEEKGRLLQPKQVTTPRRNLFSPA